MKVCLSILAFIFVISFSLSCQSIEKVQDGKIRNLLTHLSLVSEKNFKNFTLKIFSSKEYGECDGSPTTCPKSSMYIVVSTIDLYPDVGVYELPASFGWELKNVKEVNSKGEYQSYLLIELNKTVPADDLTQAWWKQENIQLKVSPWSYK
jgi:hypothetical protein